MRKLRNILWRAVPAILCGMTLVCSTAPVLPVHAEETEPGTSESAIRYAVRLYGIGVDRVYYIEDFEDDEDEFQAGMGGLTFGPALGRSDITSWTGNANHGGETASGNAHRCIHYDTWDVIVENNQKDPYIYEKCLEEGCTKSVVLTLNDDNSEATSKESKKVFDTTKATATTGDGPGVLLDEIQWPARHWADKHDRALTWSNSQIRAVLNGDEDGEYDEYGGSDYQENNSVISAFPKVLRDALGWKAVNYATSYDDTSSVSTCYDRLWLFSASELFGASALQGYQKGIYAYTNEGSRYAGASSLSISNSDGAATAYSAKGYKLPIWLRTRTLANADDYSALVATYGLSYVKVADKYEGIAPGFTLFWKYDDPTPTPDTPSTPTGGDDGGAQENAGTSASVTITKGDTVVQPLLDETQPLTGTEPTDDGVDTGNINANGDLDGNAIGATGDDSLIMLYGGIAIIALLALVIRRIRV